MTVLEIRGNRIKLGITAPSDVIVMRGELVDPAEWPSSPPETLKNRLRIVRDPSSTPNAKVPVAATSTVTFPPVRSVDDDKRTEATSDAA